MHPVKLKENFSLIFHPDNFIEQNDKKQSITQIGVSLKSIKNQKKAYFMISKPPGIGFQRKMVKILQQNRTLKDNYKWKRIEFILK